MKYTHGQPSHVICEWDRKPRRHFLYSTVTDYRCLFQYLSSNTTASENT